MIVIIGVSGCGKTTVGKLLSKKSGKPFYDADNFHPQTNIDKMKNGIPLNDKDRIPWLKLLSSKMAVIEEKTEVILACSALKEIYRRLLSENNNMITWVYLDGSFELIKERMYNRDSHFMKSQMLKSQFEDLEVPDYGLHISITESPEEIVNTIISKLKLYE